MNADCVFRMGKTHAVCQDYARAWGGEQPWLLMADGCSSSPDTDMGARLLVRAAEQVVSEVGWAAVEEASSGVACYHAATLVRAREWAQAMGLPDRALDATLLTAIVGKEEWGVALYGDGVLVTQPRQGPMQMISLSFAGGCPAYLNYQADPAREAAWRARTGNVRKVECSTFNVDGTVEISETQEAIADLAPYLCRGRIEETKWIALLTDGAHSFYEMVVTETSKAAKEIPASAVVPELMTFPNTAGVFVQRRTQRCQQLWETRGWQHRDDLSIGVLTTTA